MALSPFLNSSPKDLAYALGQTSRELRLADGVRVETFISVNGKPVLTTGPIREQSLINHYSEVRVPYRRGDRIRGHIIYTSFKKSFPYQVTKRFIVSASRPSKGFVTLSMNGKVIQSSSAMRKARARSIGKGKITYSALSRSKQSQSGRPSPEFLQRPFLRTFQTGTPASFTTSQDVVPITVYFREWTGSRTPGWGSVKRKRYVDNAHTCRIVDIQENRYSWNQEQAATGTFDLRIRPFTEIYAAPGPPVTSLELAEFNALKRLIANAGVGIQSNLAQNIAQVSQLSNLVFGNATKIMKSLRQLKRFNIPGAISALGAGRVDPRWKGPIGSPSVTKTVASNWLQLQYGWKPLLSDIEGFLKVMGNISGTTDFVQKVRGSAKASRQFMDNTYPPGDGVIGFGNSGLSTFMIQTQTKFVIRFRMDNPLAALFAQTGFTNPVSLAWELLPFSFVADWFLPIGDYFEALEAWKGMTFLGGSKTSFTRIKTDSVISYSGPAVGNPTVNVALNANFRNEQIRLVRTVLNTWPSPVLPSFNSTGLSGGAPVLGKDGEYLRSRAVNAISLLAQGFK